MVRGSQLALAFAVLEESLKGGGFAFEGAAEAANEFRGERLQDEAVFLFEKGHLGSLFDRILAAKLGRDDQLAFGGYSGEFCFHVISLVVSRSYKRIPGFEM
jgi:hypothetical protein